MNNDTFQIRHFMTDEELHTKEKPKVHDINDMNDRLFIQKKPVISSTSLFRMNENKLLTAILLNKGASNIIIVGTVNYSFSDYLIGHAEMLTLKFYWIMVCKAIYITEFENMPVIVTG